MSVPTTPRLNTPGVPGAVSSYSRIPQVQRLMEREQAQQLCRDFRREDVLAEVRACVAEVRRQLRAGAAFHPELFSDAFYEGVRAALERRRAPNLVPVINATGVVLHTNLGRAPLSSDAIAQLVAVASGYCNLEFDLEAGTRGSRMTHVEGLLCRVTVADAALVVNNCAAAVLLALSAFAQGGEVVVSRGELVEIGGGFRIPDVIAQSGARLVEVGTTNKTRLADYDKAIGPETRVLLKSHMSNFRIIGFTESVPRTQLARLARERGLCFIEDLGSGTLVELRRHGLPHEPTVQDCLRAGAELVLFSGDKLLGGPQAGLIVGTKERVAQLRTHPLMRALRADKLVLAALEASLRAYETEHPEQQLPVLRMLAASRDAIRLRARHLVRRLAQHLQHSPRVQCSVEDGVSLPGGGALPQATLPTCLVKVRVQDVTAEELAHHARRARPAVVTRISEDCLVLDLRTVAPEQDGELARVLAAVFAAALA